MLNRRALLVSAAAGLMLAGCSLSWTIRYSDNIDPQVAKSWHVHAVHVTIPDDLSISNSNSYAPNADIVWHGEPLGDRRAQVAAILRDGISRGSSGLRGPRGVTIAIRLRHFHAVTPAAVARAPGAVHNISYYAQVFDAQTAKAITPPEIISADLVAYVGDAAVIATLQGQTQRVRIVDHLARVTRGWLGIGPDPRGTFSGVGR